MSAAAAAALLLAIRTMPAARLGDAAVESAPAPREASPVEPPMARADGAVEPG
ncbi:MAG: hypothetical protein IT200_16825 [Thermoleophilia bacterium]|nr:hypothetical protein [Thermoleophilia bacterium]